MTWLADVVLAALALEAIVVLGWGRQLGLGRAETLVAMAPGAALVLALRAALAGGGVAAIGGLLVMALVGHAADLAWRRRAGRDRRATRAAR